MKNQTNRTASVGVFYLVTFAIFILLSYIAWNY